MEIEGNMYALVGDYDAGLMIINVTDPSSPVKVGNLSIEDILRISTIKIEGKFYALLLVEE